MADMSTYLSTKVADYTATELDITPHIEMIEVGQKIQALHEFDNGDIEAVSLTGTYFSVFIQWDYLSTADAATVLDFYHSKAEGMKKTFYWSHPLDGNTYVARFTNSFIMQDVAAKVAKDVPTFELRIEGVKA